MKKLSRKDVDRLKGAAREIAAIFEEMEQVRAFAHSEFERLIAELEEPREEARSVLDDAFLAAEAYFDDRSESWMDSETGQSYAEWRDRLRGLADTLAEDVEPPEIAEVETPEWVAEITEVEFAEFEP